MFMQLNILYIVNRYGTPPLNFFEKFVLEQTINELYILKLPSTNPSNSNFTYESFIMNAKTRDKKTFKLIIPTPLPELVQHILQYILNLYSLFWLTSKISINLYNIGIGESSFGSFALYLLRKISKVQYSIFMNGDIIPDITQGIKPFYLSDKNSLIYKLIDDVIIKTQATLRLIGFKNDLIWYPNENIRQWDLKNNFIPKDFIISQTVLIDINEVSRNLLNKKLKNTICYIGRLDEYAGIDISLHSLAEIKKKIPTIKLLIVGGGETSVEKYKSLAKDLGISKNVSFFGFIDSIDEAFNIIKHASIGLAMYKPSDTNVSLYAEPSKPKEYIRLGLPAIMSIGGPNIGSEMLKANVALLVEYKPESIAKAVVEFFQKDQLKSYEKSIKAFAKKYDYFEVNKELLRKIQTRYSRLIKNEVYQ